jgi:hypothetical protein
MKREVKEAEENDIYHLNSSEAEDAKKDGTFRSELQPEWCSSKQLS